MKIYILRHEDRTMDATFFSPLTEKGLENSIELIDDLKDEKIDLIYSSPFIRTLQTIYPYSKEKNVKINLEYSIAEFQHNKIIPEKSYQVRLPEYLAEKFNYNKDYNSLKYPEEFKYPEEVKDVKKRVKEFLSILIRNHANTNKNILIVTHQIVCNILSEIAYKKINTDSEYDLQTDYPKGALTLIFNKNKWNFDPVNWSYE